MFSGLAIDTAGTFKILATSSPVLTTTTSTSIVVSAAAPSQLVWTSPGQPPPSVIHNYPFGAALDLEDQYGNLETGSDDFVSIVLDNNPTGASLGGDTTANLVDGVASFTDLSISAVGNGYTLQGTATTGTTSAGITSAASDPIDVTPTPAVSLAITVSTSVECHRRADIQLPGHGARPVRKSRRRFQRRRHGRPGQRPDLAARWNADGAGKRRNRHVL